MLEQTRGRVFRLAAAVLIAGCSAFAAEIRDDHEQRVGKGMSLISVFPGKTVTSAPLSIRVDASGIPDNAVVERVSVVTGTVAKGNRATGVNVVASYNIKGPSMAAYVPQRWAGQGRTTTFDAGELGRDDIPVKGTWLLTMTGNNVGNVRATTTHTVRLVKIDYRYEKE